MAKKIEIEVVGDTKDLERALSRTARKTESSFRKIGKAAGVAGLTIAAGLGVAAKIAFDELSDMQRVTAQTEAVLKSTGGAANVTAEHVRELAESISEYSGADDEAVQAGENILLTFHKIENQAGKNNDIFDQATKAVSDLSQAMGMDLSAAALQVGKALNDPARGLTRLQRIGVVFTEGQKKMIEKLVESGRTLDAQKIILAELNKEFGGSAKAFGETMPGQIAKAQESFKNLSAELLVAALPAITAVAEHLQKLAAFLRENPKLAKAAVIGFAGLAAGLLVLSAASGAMTVATVGLTAALIGLSAVLVVPAIIAAAAALFVLYQRSETFRKAVDTLRKHWLLLVAAIPVLGPAAALIIRKFDTIKAVGTAAFNAVRSAVQFVISTVQSLISYVERLIDAIHRIPVIGSIGGGSGSDMFQGGHGPRGGSQQGGFVQRSGLGIIHKGEQITPARVARGGAGMAGGGGQFALVWAGPDFVAWMRDQDQRTRRGNGGRGIL